MPGTSHGSLELRIAPLRAPAPSDGLAGFRFTTIGQQPGLLSRISARRDDYERTPSPSPPPPESDEVTANESYANNDSNPFDARTRPTLLEALAGNRLDGDGDIVMQNTTPAAALKSKNIFAQPIVFSPDVTSTPTPVSNPPAITQASGAAPVNKNSSSSQGPVPIFQTPQGARVASSAGTPMSIDMTPSHNPLSFQLTGQRTSSSLSIQPAVTQVPSPTKFSYDTLRTIHTRLLSSAASLAPLDMEGALVLARSAEEQSEKAEKAAQRALDVAQQALHSAQESFNVANETVNAVHEAKARSVESLKALEEGKSRADEWKLTLDNLTGDLASVGEWLAERETAVAARKEVNAIRSSHRGRTSRTPLMLPDPDIGQVSGAVSADSLGTEIEHLQAALRVQEELSAAFERERQKEIEDEKRATKDLADKIRHKLEAQAELRRQEEEVKEREREEREAAEKVAEDARQKAALAADRQRRREELERRKVIEEAKARETAKEEEKARETAREEALRLEQAKKRQEITMLKQRTISEAAAKIRADRARAGCFSEGVPSVSPPPVASKSSHTPPAEPPIAVNGRPFSPVTKISTKQTSATSPQSQPAGVSNIVAQRTLAPPSPERSREIAKAKPKVEPTTSLVPPPSWTGDGVSKDLIHSAALGLRPGTTAVTSNLKDRDNASTQAKAPTHKPLPGHPRVAVSPASSVPPIEHLSSRDDDSPPSSPEGPLVWRDSADAGNLPVNMQLHPNISPVIQAANIRHLAGFSQDSPMADVAKVKVEQNDTGVITALKVTHKSNLVPRPQPQQRPLSRTGSMLVQLESHASASTRPAPVVLPSKPSAQLNGQLHTPLSGDAGVKSPAPKSKSSVPLPAKPTSMAASKPSSNQAGGAINQRSQPPILAPTSQSHTKSITNSLPPNVFPPERSAPRTSVAGTVQPSSHPLSSTQVPKSALVPAAIPPTGPAGKGPVGARSGSLNVGRKQPQTPQGPRKKRKQKPNMAEQQHHAAPVPNTRPPMAPTQPKASGNHTTNSRPPANLDHIHAPFQSQQFSANSLPKMVTPRPVPKATTSLSRSLPVVEKPRKPAPPPMRASPIGPDMRAETGWGSVHSIEDSYVRSPSVDSSRSRRGRRRNLSEDSRTYPSRPPHPHGDHYSPGNETLEMYEERYYPRPRYSSSPRQRSVERSRSRSPVVWDSPRNNKKRERPRDEHETPEYPPRKRIVSNSKPWAGEGSDKSFASLASIPPVSPPLASRVDEPYYIPRQYDDDSYNYETSGYDHYPPPPRYSDGYAPGPSTTNDRGGVGAGRGGLLDRLSGSKRRSPPRMDPSTRGRGRGRGGGAAQRRGKLAQRMQSSTLMDRLGR